MSCFEVLELLEKTSGKNDKLAILKGNLKTPGLAELLLATFDYRKNYYIKQLPEIHGDSNKTVDNIVGFGTTNVDRFAEILALCERDGRTQATKTEVYTWLECQHPVTAKWLRRVILRDLRCGFSVDTAIKAGFAIPTFEAQLAMDANKCKKLRQLVEAGVWISRKMDGYRCVAIIRNGVATLYSRNGSVFENFPTVVAALERECEGRSLVLDGEIMSDDFNSMQQSAFASKRGTTVGDVKYFVFDQIPVEEWDSGKFSTLYADRLAALGGSHLGSTGVVLPVQHMLVKSLDVIKEWQSAWEDQGYEGAMAKPNIPYYFGRKTNTMLKFKSTLTQDCVVTGIEEGEGRLSGTLGKLIVRQENGEVCGVGSGLDDASRDYIWIHQSETIGRILEIKYQELTPDGVMRFPIFLRFRDKGAGGKV